MFRGTMFRRSFSSDKDLKGIADSLSKMSDTYVKRVNSKSFKNYIFTHPFKAYFKIASVVFGGVFAANTLCGAFSEDPPVSPYEYPQTFAWMNMTKSMYFGLVWPSVPFMLFNKDSRRDLCVLGTSIEKVQTQIIDSLEGESTQASRRTKITINGVTVKDDKENISEEEINKEMNKAKKNIEDAKKEIQDAFKDFFK
jgi:hypothetical protein